MATASDDRRIRKLPVITTESQRALIDLAVTLWQARHGDVGPINPTVRGEVLAKICAQWRAEEIDAIRGE